MNRLDYWRSASSLKQMRLAVLAVIVVFIGCSPETTPQFNSGATVFIGDSITQFWDLDSSFPGKGYVNAGIKEQTTTDVLTRFFTDVIQQKPRSVVILVGTNDILRHDSIDQAILNIRAIVAEARVRGAYPVVCTIPPVDTDITLQQGAQYAGDFNPDIQRFNLLIQTDPYLSTTCDIHKVLSDPNTELPLTGVLKDGVHPSELGYQFMTEEVAKSLP